MKIALIFATRPEIIKLWPLIDILKKNKINFFSVNTGQHYSKNLNSIFFKKLKIDKPKYKLNIKLNQKINEGSFIGKMIISIERILIKEKPDIVIVHGDTNTSLAGAIATKKISNKFFFLKKNIKLIHIEAGLRSFDQSMSEETNRILIDHISDILFTPTKTDYKNLIKENINKKKIIISGNTIIDSLKKSYKKIKGKEILEKNNIKIKKYILVTLHRPELVEYSDKLLKVLNTINELGRMNNLPIIFPIHPRTYNNIKKYMNKLSCINFIKPIGYFEFLKLLKNCKIVFTDSGGIQEESYFFKIPCVTVRNNTERPNTITDGKNILSGYERENIFKSFYSSLKKKQSNNKIYGTGNASRIIFEHIKNFK
jgi:UDP-N-acetylglucosamine 2-epimerase (non-hydrolysing)